MPLIEYVTTDLPTPNRHHLDDIKGAFCTSMGQIKDCPVSRRIIRILAKQCSSHAFSEGEKGTVTITVTAPRNLIKPAEFKLFVAEATLLTKLHWGESRISFDQTGVWVLRREAEEFWADGSPVTRLSVARWILRHRKKESLAEEKTEA